MANYSELIATINDQIKANGNQEITGPVLNAVLQAMVTSLGEGYQFMGVATPDTNPGTPDEKVFYIATEPGTYSNFGVIVPKGGIGIIYNTSSDWVVTLVGEISQELGSSEDAVMSQKAITDKFTELQDAIDNQKAEVDAAKEEAMSAISNREQEAIDNFSSQRVTPEMLSESTKQLINASGGGTITNLADDEDIESVDIGDVQVLKFKDRAYNASNFSGLGYKILRKNVSEGKNILTQDMMNAANTAYEIRYDFDLNGATITVPENCILKFNGGSLSNGKLVGQKTIIQSLPIFIFKTLTFSGIFLNEWFAEWFGASNSKTDNSPELNYAITSLYSLDAGGCLVLSARYDTQDTIYLRSKVSIRGISRNSHFYQGGSGTNFVKEGCGIRYTGTKENLWVVDFMLPDGTHKDYNDMYVGSIRPWADTRFSGIFIKDIDILVIDDAEKNVFGGLRLNNFYNCLIDGIGIYGTLYGICLSTCWNNTFSNLYITTYVNAIYMGWNCTVNSFVNSYLLKLNDKTVEPWGGAIFKYPDDIFPPYAENLKSSAIIAESSETDGTRVNLSDFIVQGYGAILCAQRFDGNLNFMYLEGRFETFFWIADGRVLAMNPSPLNRKALSGYEFGTKSGYIYAKNYRYCRCWNNSEVSRDLNIVCYDIEMNNKLPIYYYDSWTGDETSAVSDMIKTPTKRFLGNTQIFMGRTKVTEPENDSLHSDLAFGNSRSTSISIKEFFTRPEYNGRKAVYASYAELSVFTEPIVGRKHTIDAAGFSPLASAFKFTAPLPIRNCELTFDCGFMGDKADHFFDVYDKNVIILNKLKYMEKKMVKLCGTNRIDLTFIVNNDYNGNGVLNNFLMNPEFEYPYRIKLITKNFVRIFTNTSRPTLGTNDRGYEYFDQTLNKPIWWTGTKWTDAAGADV